MMRVTSSHHSNIQEGTPSLHDLVQSLGGSFVEIDDGVEGTHHTSSGLFIHFLLVNFPKCYQVVYELVCRLQLVFMNGNDKMTRLRAQVPKMFALLKQEPNENVMIFG